MIADDEHEREAQKYLKYDKDKQIANFISPVTGKSFKIKGVTAKLSTSAGGLDDLRKIEEDIIGMSVLPDFGYGSDNYLLTKDNDA